eukprot:gnl/MRDRNA2_/MRDRNA2_87948_c0_seq1.p1 gnl/MRDRNA2_/MRDRNA2_87948_c0~~gnl/MRDRNA2_/MRDRNA2_87948_c0_seq1.p1  ORF type:complete len:316 (+),score=68.08 gnl/MRDRNA2_/MRDRNA2_87948_c0_seq1:124-1071(+)
MPMMIKSGTSKTKRRSESGTDSGIEASSPKRRKAPVQDVMREINGAIPDHKASSGSSRSKSDHGCKDLCGDGLRELKFVHITKNAGTAIEGWAAKMGLKWGKMWNAALQQARKDLLPPFEGKIQSEPWHIPPQYFRTNPYSRFETFAIVRNPYERMISEFRCKWKGFQAPAKSADKKARRLDATAADLNAWIEKKIHSMRRRECTNGCGRRMGELCVFANGHCVPQHLYIFAPDGSRCIPSANVIHFENLDAEFSELLRRYGMLDPPSLEKINESDMRKFTTSDLSASSRQLIEEAYARDFDEFGYDRLPSSAEQ